MSSRSKRGGSQVSGNPAKRKAITGADLMRWRQPTGVFDPRRLGGAISGPGGPRDHGMTILDTTDAVLMQHVDVATIDAVRVGELTEQAIFMTLAGRVNKSSDQVSVGFIFGPDGAAALVSELLALADRFGAELLGDLVARLRLLRQEGNVDLEFVKAAIEVAMEES